MTVALTIDGVPAELPRNTILVGDVLERLAELPDDSVHCVVTSPPYWSLRDYKVEATVWGGDEDCEHLWSINHTQTRGGVYASKTRWQHGDGQAILRAENPEVWGHPEVASGDSCAHCGAWRGALGLEPTPDLFVEHLVDVMREVRRVLRKDGTCWLNLGDCYMASRSGPIGDYSTLDGGDTNMKESRLAVAAARPDRPNTRYSFRWMGLKPKDLVGIPWRVAFALQSDGWWLRSDIIWSKPNPMPESVTDRPTKAHEYVFLLSKSDRYFYDAEAVREPQSGNAHARRKGGRRDINEQTAKVGNVTHLGWKDNYVDVPGGRNKRTVWEIATRPFAEAHFATFPQALVEPCIKAGTSERGCCPDCGAPWVRVVEKSDSSHEGQTESRYTEGSNANRIALARQAARERGEEYAQTSLTVGWEPSCRCYDHLYAALPRTKNPRRRRGQDVTGAFRARGRKYAFKDVTNQEPAIVLDPFMGSGTTALAAMNLVPRRDWLGIDLNPEYVAMAEKRLPKGRLL